MTTRREPKKSETVEVRVPYLTKVAFAARCRDEGRTVSDAVRALMEQAPESPAAGRWRKLGWPALAAALVGLALGSIAAPSLAESAPLSRAAFDRLDRDHDGVLRYEEFRSR